MSPVLQRRTRLVLLALALLARFGAATTLSAAPHQRQRLRSRGGPKQGPEVTSASSNRFRRVQSKLLAQHRAYPTDPPKPGANPSGIVNPPNPALGQPAQFDPVIMAAAVRAMEQKARMGAHPAPIDAPLASMGALAPPGAGPTVDKSVLGDSPMTPDMLYSAQSGHSPPLPALAGGSTLPVPRGQAVRSPFPGAPPVLIKDPRGSKTPAGPAPNPFSRIQPPAQAFETNPLAYAAPGVAVLHPSQVGAAAVAEASGSAPMSSAYFGVQLPYHPDQAMANGAIRARDYLSRSREALREGEGLGYGAGAFPPPHKEELPPKFGGAVEGFPTPFGTPGSGVAGGPRAHLVTPGFTPHRGNALYQPVHAFLETQEWYRGNHNNHMRWRGAHGPSSAGLLHFRSTAGATQRWGNSVGPMVPFTSVPVKDGPVYMGPSIFAPLPYGGIGNPITEKDKEYWKKKMMHPKMSVFGPGFITPPFEKDPNSKDGRLKPVYYPGPGEW